MAEGARLESVYTATYRGFESPLTAIFKEELVRKCELFFSHFICLYGSEHGGRVEYVTSEFLSCLYGSERSLQPLAKTVGFSKLPVRQ